MIKSDNFDKGTNPLLMRDAVRRVYQALSKHPASTGSSLSKEMQLTAPSVFYHLEKLEQLDMVDKIPVGKKVAYSIKNMILEKDMYMFTLLSDRKAKKVFNSIMRSPKKQKELAKAEGIKRQTVRWYADLLKKAGLIEEVQDGASCFYFPTDLIQEKAEFYEARVESMKEETIDGLIMDGLNPEEKGYRGNNLVIEIGPDKQRRILEINLNPLREWLNTDSSIDEKI